MYIYIYICTYIHTLYIYIIIIFPMNIACFWRSIVSKVPPTAGLGPRFRGAGQGKAAQLGCKTCHSWGGTHPVICISIYIT